MRLISSVRLIPYCCGVIICAFVFVHKIDECRLLVVAVWQSFSIWEGRMLGSSASKQCREWRRNPWTVSGRVVVELGVVLLIRTTTLSIDCTAFKE